MEKIRRQDGHSDTYLFNAIRKAVEEGVKMEHENEMAQFVGKGFIPTPIEKIEIKPYDFTVEDEID